MTDAKNATPKQKICSSIADRWFVATNKSEDIHTIKPIWDACLKLPESTLLAFAKTCTDKSREPYYMPVAPYISTMPQDVPFAIPPQDLTPGQRYEAVSDHDLCLREQYRKALPKGQTR